MSTTIPDTSLNRDDGELRRLRETYKHRLQSIPAQRYSRLNPGHLFSLHEREATMAALLSAQGLTSFAGMRILDVGCGKGLTLRQYVEYGGEPSRMCGVDLYAPFVEEARAASPGMQIHCGSASDLQYSDGSFDFVSQFMLFTSVLDQRMRFEIAREINRVLAPGGHLLWYDFGFNNPANPDVRGIRLSEVRQLFPDFSMASRRITLAPPLGRAVGKLGPTVYFLLSKIRPLCTHYLCLLTKP